MKLSKMLKSVIKKAELLEKELELRSLENKYKDFEELWFHIPVSVPDGIATLMTFAELKLWSKNMFNQGCAKSLKVVKPKGVENVKD